MSSSKTATPAALPSKTPAVASTINATTQTAPIKILRPGKVVILLNGRYAGHKAFIVNPFEGNRKSIHLFIHPFCVAYCFRLCAIRFFDLIANF